MKKETTKILSFGIITGLLTAIILRPFRDQLSQFYITDIIAFGVILFVSFYVLVFIHELGHLVCGFATGYRFVSFRWLNYLVKRNINTGKLEMLRFGTLGTMGQCLMLPPDTEDIPLFWYNFGGVFFNTLHGILTLVFMFLFRSYWMTVSGIIMLFMNGFFIYLNWFSTEVQSSDGYNYRMTRDSQETQRAFAMLLRVNALLNEGFGLTSDALSVIASVPLRAENAIQANALHYYAVREMTSGNMNLAATLFDILLSGNLDPKGIVKSLVEADYYLLQLVVDNPNAMEYKTDSVAKVLKAMRTNEGVYMIHVLESVYLTRQKDPIKSAELQRFCDRSVTPGFARECLEFTESVSESLIMNHNSSY